MKTIEINENHRRVLGSAMRMLRRMLNDFIRIVGEDRRFKRNAFSEEQTKELLKNIETAQCNIARFITQFNLSTKREPAPEWSIQVGVARMWEMLEDCKSKRLKGYGELAEFSRSKIDNNIQNLIDIFNNIGDIARQKSKDPQI